MMVLCFYKYQGTGNDFILIDNRKQPGINYTTALIQHLCDRRFGIGADGLILLQNHQQYDFEMVYYNANASQSLCGNGSRCAVHLARSLNMIGTKTRFLTINGVYQAAIKDAIISLHLKDVPAIQPLGTDYFVDTGSPHYVQLVDDVAKLDVMALGQSISNRQAFQKAGTNVNFVQVTGKNTIFVRTYERGVEAETLSCGTGAIAASLVAATKGLMSPIAVATKGGQLQVCFKVSPQGFTAIHLIGPAVMSFQGAININMAQFAMKNLL